jgi:DNA-binding LacI/PurR family transcriptional regulator
MNDLLALGAMRAAREAGLSVPQDLSFIGVGDVPVGRFLPVSLSSIAEPLEEMARAAVAQILDESPVQDVELSATFVERESIGPAKDLITSACASRRESCVSPRRGGG